MACAQFLLDAYTMSYCCVQYPIASLRGFFVVVIIFFSLCNFHDAKNHVVPYSEVIVPFLVQFSRVYSFGRS